MPLLSRLYLKSVSVAGLAKVFSVLAAIVALWQLNTLMGKSEFGAFMVVFSLLSIITLAWAGFFQSLILYHGARDQSGAPSLFLRSSLTYGLGGAMALTALLAGLAPIFAKLLGQSQLDLLFITTASVIPAQFVNRVLCAYQRACQRVPMQMLYQEFLPGLIRIILLGVLMMTHAPIEWIGGVYALSYAVPSLVLYLKAPFSPSLSHECFTGWNLRYGIQTSLGQVLNQSTRQLGILLSGFLAGTVIAADFAVATRFGQLLLIPKNAIVQLLTPRMGRHLSQGSFDALIPEFKATQSLMIYASLTGIIGYVLFAPFVLPWFGDYGIQTYSLLLILSIASLIRAGFGDIGGLISMAGHSGAAFIVHGAHFALLLVGFLIMVPLLESQGAAFAIVIGAIGAMGMNAGVVYFYYRWLCLNITDAIALIVASVLLINLAYGVLPPLTVTSLIALTLFAFALIRLKPTRLVFMGAQ